MVIKKFLFYEKVKCMKNIILQHWTGNMREIEKLSSINIAKYANQVNADYRLLRGNVFRPNLTSPCQKVYMLDKEFDEYDIVVMLDCDVFTRKGMVANIFTDETGYGISEQIHKNIAKRIEQKYPHLGNSKYSYWGGAIYRFPKDVRQSMRQYIKDDEMIKFSGSHHTYQDEGIMHRLAVMSQIEGHYISPHWAYSSFEPDVEKGHIIHIRTKITPTGPRRTKIENYRDLVKRGIIE